MKRVNRLSQGICLAALGFVLWIVLFDRPLKDSSFGPAAYYYTDIPDWQSRFYGAGSLMQTSEAFILPAIILSLAAAWVFLRLLLSAGKKTGPPEGRN